MRAFERTRLRFAGMVLVLVVLTVALLLAIPIVWPVLQIFTIVLLLTVALDGVIRWQMLRGLPRWAATVNLLFAAVLGIGIVVYLLLPPLLEQLQQFGAGFPKFWATVSTRVNVLFHRVPQLQQATDLNRFAEQVFSGAGAWLKTARSLFTSALGAVTAIILITISTLYLLFNPWPLLYGVRGLFPTSWWSTLDQLANSIAARIRAWALGTLFVSALIGVLDYIGLLIINQFFHHALPFIFLFAILGALLEIFPIVGPLIAIVIPTLVGFSINPLLGLYVLGVFLLIQELEAHIIIPLVMRQTLHLHPVSLIFALVVLSSLFGIFGAVIAVPVAATLKVLYDEWYYPLLHQGEAPLPAPEEQWRQERADGEKS